jgi:hypothetical protein
VYVEYTVYAPRPDIVPGVRVRAAPMPWISGRRPLFERMLADRPFLRPALDRLEPPADPAWYTPAALAGRAPDFVVLDSFFYDRFSKGQHRVAYPEIAGFFDWISGATLHGAARDCDVLPVRGRCTWSPVPMHRAARRSPHRERRESGGRTN